MIIGAELDAGETCLMLTDESKQQYASAMAAKRQREQEEVKAREALRLLHLSKRNPSNKKRWAGVFRAARRA